MRTYKWIFFLILVWLLSGCASADPVPAAQKEAYIPASLHQKSGFPFLEVKALHRELPNPAVSTVLEAAASGTLEKVCDVAQIDYSHTEEGYVMIRYTGQTEQRLKVLVKGPTTKYSYNLPKQEWTVFPLSDGSGTYEIGVYENVTGNKYATVLTLDYQVTLLDEFAPFLRPNQYVNFSQDTHAVALGLELTKQLEDPLAKVEAVYDYVVETLEYDYEKAATVKSGYLPDLDQVLADRKGICFDYAALMTAMLRSQQIPCKLVIGYAGSTYHAWISVWTEESGWVDGIIFFDGHQWKRMDPTFASTSAQSDEIMEFIRSGDYKVKYLY